MNLVGGAPKMLPHTVTPYGMKTWHTDRTLVTDMPRLKQGRIPKEKPKASFKASTGGVCAVV